MQTRKNNKIEAKKTYTIIENVDYSSIEIQEDNFELYEFRNCIFSNVSGIDFTDCIFIICNLSNLVVRNCKLMDLTFVDCKLLGVNFSEAKSFGFSIQFENCVLDYSSFDRKKLNKSSFTDCRIHEANFTEADLSKSSFTKCDFLGTLFSNTNLSGVDFTTSYNFTLDPSMNIVKKAKFLSTNLAGLLTKFDIIIE
jgi:uncharacterized protein YjbI with pentapeptide repeats